MAKVINVKKLIDHLGGPTELQRKLEGKGHPISLKGVNMWGYRKRIPGPWLTTLVTEFNIKLKDFTEDELAFLE